MKKLFSALAILASISVSAQTLFYYGNDSVSVREFLKAYYKNNTGTRNQKVFTDYLQLYINSRLKIKEARERHYDTLSQINSELENLRQQILPTYLKDKQGEAKLTEEAFQRSQKDIHLAHIFISFSAGGNYDTLSAEKKLGDVLAKLKSGATFSAVAKQYSDDPSAASNEGDLGYITVFDLPYELENLAYNIGVGKISPAYRSIAGYHIFKNMGERRDLGKVRAAQILLAFPPDADQNTKLALKKTADSLYNRLQKGDDFGKLAAQFSNDNQSSQFNGLMPDVLVGQYDAIFEKNVFALPADGLISKPFQDLDGYHIVKRLKKSPVFAKSDSKSMSLLKTKVEQSDRMKSQRTALTRRIMNDAGYKQYPFSEELLWAYSDSVINYTKPGRPLHLNNGSPLFSIGNKTLTVGDWINYAQTFRYKADGSGVKPYRQIWNEFVEASVIDFYQKNIEVYNEEFRSQLNEFKEGNLFFEIMQRQIWGPAQTDSAALVAYYDKNKQKYTWKESADAVIFYASDMNTARIFTDQLKKDPNMWHTLVGSFSEKLAADSSRFELSQIPNGSKAPLKPGIITGPLINKADNTVSFAYVIRLHTKPEQRSFNDAKGLVMNDYQTLVEKDWIEALRAKYPVRINEKELSDLIRSKKF